jgi:polyvinyl alcohol dehydrogenase (cytochrome)
VLAAALAGLAVVAGGSAVAVSVTDWPAYLGGPQHGSFNAADTAITPAGVMAASLVQKWHHGGGFISSPVVADGSAFIGSFTGYFYKLNATTGSVQKKIFLGFQPNHGCGAFGFASTATVAPDPVTSTDMVYVAAPDGWLHALNAATLQQKWQAKIAIPSTTVNDYFQWSSPAVANGKIYVGISSNCDHPLVRGGVIGFDQATGKWLAVFHTVPKGQVGGSVWSTPAVDASGDVYITTGNGPTKTNIYYTDSIVKLSPALVKIASWTVPAVQVTGDGDFGASPTLFSATINSVLTPMIGACNKNGIYYALSTTTMQVLWQVRIGARASGKVMAQCQAAAAWDGSHLFMAGPATTILGTAYRGSVEEVDPATGTFLWQTGMPNGPLSSPAMNGGGVLAIGTWDNTSVPNATYLFDASTGTPLTPPSAPLTTGNDFGQTVFAGGWIYAANSTGVYAFGP